MISPGDRNNAQKLADKLNIRIYSHAENVKF